MTLPVSALQSLLCDKWCLMVKVRLFQMLHSNQKLKAKTINKINKEKFQTNGLFLTKTDNYETDKIEFNRVF